MSQAPSGKDSRNMVNIIPATENDMPLILEIKQEAISPLWTHGALLGELYKDDSYFVVAVESTCVIGFAILRQVGDDGELLQIAVDKNVRRRGTADMLMRAILEYVENNALKSVFLEARKSNTAAIALYKKLGFIELTRVKQKSLEDKNSNIAIYMKKSGL